MNQDVVAAKKILDTDYTCVVCYKGVVLTSKKECNEAIFDFLKSKFDFSMYAIAVSNLDFIGANLIIELGIKNVFSYKVSDKALELLNNNNITSYHNEIINPLDESLDYEKYIKDRFN